MFTRCFCYALYSVRIKCLIDDFLFTGMSNTAGTFAAILGTVGAGFFVDRMGSFRGFLILTSLLYFSSTLFWDIFATGERVDFDGTG